MIVGGEEGKKRKKKVGVILYESVQRIIMIPVNGSKEVLGGSSPRRSRSHHVLLGDPVG